MAVNQQDVFFSMKLIYISSEMNTKRRIFFQAKCIVFWNDTENPKLCNKIRVAVRIIFVRSTTQL